MSVRNTLWRAARLAPLMLALLAASASAQHNPDRAVFGWFLGLPVYLFASTPPALGGEGPARPTPQHPDVTVYLINPINDTSPHGPQVEIPTPNGRRTLPPHMDVLDRLTFERRPHDAIGTFVVPGPRATAQNVHSGPQPPNSIVGAPLAYEIKIGEEWVPLTSHVVIQYGLDAGLLTTRPFDYGGLMWVQFAHADTVGDFTVDVEVESGS